MYICIFVCLYLHNERIVKGEKLYLVVAWYSISNLFPLPFCLQAWRLKVFHHSPNVFILECFKAPKLQISIWKFTPTICLIMCLFILKSSLVAASTSITSYHHHNSCLFSTSLCSSWGRREEWEPTFNSLGSGWREQAEGGWGLLVIEHQDPI